MADQLLSEEAACPFDNKPVSLNPQLVISDEDFSPPGAKFELTLNMVKENSNVVESCSVQVQKKFSESTQSIATFSVKQSEEVADPTRVNTFECESSETQTNSDPLVYTWEVIDVFKGSKIFLSDLT